MTDDSRVIWSYTERHLREWMEGMHEEYHGGALFDFPDPRSLTPDQIDTVYLRLHEMVENSDGPRDDMREFAWYILSEMGLIHDVRRRSQ